MRFSIITVCFNAGNKLIKTVESALAQSFTDYEIIIKDGGSTDGSLSKLPSDDRIRVIEREDSGIYDAMNQAVAEAKGEYIYFLNCGDYFFDDDNLKKVSAFISENNNPGIVYGNIFERSTSCLVQSNPSLNEFGCYRNVPCHQACFYKANLFEERGFDIKYKVRADYEHFIWCMYKTDNPVTPMYIEWIIASYEGGGFSEINNKLSAIEHKEITLKYFGKQNCFKYKMILLLTLAPLRTKIASFGPTAVVYNGLKKIIYQKRNR